MFKVKKIINNNALLVVNLEDDNEIILLGNGIGFNRKPDEEFSDTKGSKIYTMNKKIDKSLDELDPAYLEISDIILKEALKSYKEVNQSVLLALADHISFAIERMKNGIEISNPFSKDIALLFPKEHQLALNSRDIIHKKTGFLINDDEISYITLHIHSALDKSSVAESMKHTIIINETMSMIENMYQLDFNKDSLSYARMLVHLKYMFARLKKNEHLHLDMDEYVSSNFAESYKVAKKICHTIEEKSALKIPYTEIGYLAIHIERIKNSQA